MDNNQVEKFQEAKKFVQTFLSSVTELSLPQLKLYLKNLQKQLSVPNQSSVYSEYKTITEIINHTVEGKGKGALHFACARGDIDIVKLLVQEYKADIHLKDSEKHTPFLTAIQHRHLDIVRYFVEELGEPVNGTVEGNTTALHLAANNDGCDIIEYLLSKGADIEKISIYGKPLNWAVGSNRTEAAILLLEKGADPNGDPSGPFPAPVILALDFNNKTLFDKLLEKGANLQAKDPNGYSILHLAAEKGNLQTVKLLVSKGLDISYQAEDKTAYYLAFENGHWEVVEYLKQIMNKDCTEAIQKLIKDRIQKKANTVMNKEEATKKANELKQIGNKHYANKNLSEAIEEYSKAIEFDPSNNILYSNRAAAYLATKQYEKTIDDCKIAKSINPKHIKTLVREAQAYQGLNNHLEASISFWEALKLEPHNQEVMKQFQKSTKIAKEQHAKPNII